jgi:hypothetical protein
MRTNCAVVGRQIIGNRDSNYQGVTRWQRAIFERARREKEHHTFLSWSEVVQSRPGDAPKASLHRTTSRGAHTLSLI